MKTFRFKTHQLRYLFFSFGLLVILAYLAFVVWRYWQDITLFFQPQQAIKTIEDHFQGNNPVNFVVLTALTALTTAIPFLSSSVLAVFNGLVFGPWLATLMNIIASVLGNYLVLLLMKRIDVTDRDPKLARHLSLLKRFKNPDLGLIFGYMIPFIPSFLINYNVSQTQISRSKWLLCVLIGVTPASILYAFGGHAIFKGNWRLLAVILLMMLLVYVVYHSVEKKKSDKT